MAEGRLPWLIVTSPADIFYLTGFQGSAGVAGFSQQQALLWVDPRYTLQAREQAEGVEVVEEKRGLLGGVANWLRRHKAREVGFDPEHLTYAEYNQLARGTIALRPAGDCIRGLRAVKDSEEVAHIRRAGHITSAVYEEILGQVRPGLRESDLAAEIEYRIRKRGGEGVAFETIVASGARGALPHARASSKLLEKNDLVILDLGAIVHGYAADMTRTISLGEPSRRVRSLYKAVADAQRRAVQATRAGVMASDVDATARRSLAKHGLARYFTHSTGHGVGLDVHERPRLGRGERGRLKAGSVVTVEPGIYLEGLGGIRLEDTVLVGAGDPEILTPASKDHWVVA